MFKNKTAVVTGAGNDCCSEIAISLARQGATVVLVDSDKALLDAVQQEIETFGGRAIVRACDCTDLSAVMRLAKEIKEQFGCCDYLVNGSGKENIDVIPAVTSITVISKGSYALGLVQNNPKTIRFPSQKLDLCI